MHIDLYHGTTDESAELLLNNGWKPLEWSLGANQGQPKYLYCTTSKEDALWFSEQKGSNVVLLIKKVPLDYLIVDPEDGVNETVEEELLMSVRTGFPAKLAIKISLEKEFFTRII
jgi:hypothetical protein